MSTHVISVCSPQHLPVWHHTSRQLLSHVVADAYTVITPDNSVGIFIDHTPDQIEVIAESEVDPGFGVTLRTGLTAAANTPRFGWYYQQLLKIQAMVVSTADHLLIWDADCVPTSNIEVFNPQGQPMMMYSSEFNSEYFVTIQRLLGLPKLKEQSFIAPYFPIRKTWLNNFIEYVESRFPHLNWHEAILACTNLEESSAFSEYETLGTWVEYHHSDDIGETKYKWERFGTSRFGQASHLSTTDIVRKSLGANLSIVSFENWDRRRLRWAIKRVSRGFRSLP